MPAPHNTLKAALATKTVQMGLWMNLVSPIAAEALSGTGFDWLLIDGEHGPNDIPTILAQVQAIGSRTSVVVRPPVGEVRMIKQLLDLGVQTILVPMIESADHAAQMVKAMHYPPVGMRGVGATIARASDYGRITDYITTANDQTCLILQIESRAGLAALPEILKLDGVDGVFIGPADLAADMGYPGNAAAPEVQATIDSTLAAIMASGKSAGILTFDAKVAQRYAAMGVAFLGIGSDVAVLVKAMTATLQAAKAG
jgi:4-hydroxy-2-oxoheptanedioate aldolase